MATSGSFDTNHRVSGSYNTYATFSWWQTGQSIDGNYTDISWSLTGKTASSGQNIYVYGVSVTVNGATTSKNFNARMYNGTTLLTGTARIYHNNDGSKNFSASAGLAMYSSSSWYSGSGSWNLDSIPRKATIKSAPNFNDEENPTITYENKAGNSVNSLQACISLDGSKDDIAYRDISKTGTSYKFNLTEAERNVLRNATKTSNSRTVKFFVRTTIGGNTFYDSVDKTFSIVNANPVFSNYTFHDGNSTTTDITGNDQWIIQNKSSLVVDITPANKATAKKNATMASYVYEISSYSGSANYTTSDLSKTIGAINATQNQNLKVIAIDSRNNSTSVSKTVNIVPYATPVLNVSATRQNNFEANTTIKVSGSVSLLKVNNVVKNTVNATNGVQYRKKQSSTTTWESWTNIPSSYNTSTGAVTVSDFVISLDNQQAWDFEFKLTDRLETKTVAISVSQGQPQFFIGSDGRVAVGGLPSISLPSGNTGQLEVYGDVYAKNLRSTGNAYANGNRLAELPITKDMLGSKSVSSDKIDWTTMRHVSNVGSSVIDVTKTVTRLCEVTIPEAGVYYASATVDPNLLGNNVGDANVHLALNGGNSIAGSQVFFNNNGKNWFIGGVHVSAIVSCKKGDKIQLRGQSQADKWQAGERRRLDAFRIG